MTDDENRVLNLVRAAFRGVTLGDGVGLREARGLDDYADSETLAAYRAQDEKTDWSAISVEDLNYFGDSLSFFDAEGMRFHLPAYLAADLQGALSGDVLFHLVYFEDSALTRFEKLTDSQRHAVREFLLLRLSDPNREFVHPMIERALSEFWLPT